MNAPQVMETAEPVRVPRSLVIGCGYIGLPLARRLLGGGHEVSGWVHSEATAEKLMQEGFRRMVTGNVADDDLWTALEEKFDLVIHCASSGGGGETAYEQVFLKGALMMNAHQPQARRIFVSSTSVYHQAQGEVVTEESDAMPSTATGRVLRVAEKVALNAGATVVRSSGIYGPGRAALWHKFQRGDAVLEGDGKRWINQVHQTDLVHAITHLIDGGAFGEIYNVTDDTPVTQLDFYTWCAGFLQKPLPPLGPVDPHRKRGLTNKRVSNAKLRATGWAPIYPSFREGIAAMAAAI